MLTLAIDTATKICAVALCRNGELVGESRINAGLTHSEGLMPQIEQLLERTGIEKKQIDLVAVSMGPGSFTGLRIGLAAAEAMAYAWQKPLVGVNTATALAYNVPIEGVVLSPVLDAQKGNYYQALYEWQGGELCELQAVQVVTFEQMLENLAVQGKPALLLGECDKIAVDALPQWCKPAAKQLRLPQAMSIALAVLAKYVPGEGSGFFGMEPYYIRRSEAEELWEQRQQKQSEL